MLARQVLFLLDSSQANSFALTLLRPLELSWLSFSHLFLLLSATYSLFFQNTRGGVPRKRLRDNRGAGPFANHITPLNPASRFASALCFHNLTNCSSRNPFLFTSMQNPRARGGRNPRSRPAFLRALCVSVANPFLSYSCELFVVAKKLIPIAISNFHTLFTKYPEGVGIPGRFCGTQEWDSSLYPSGANRRAASAIGSPTQNMWMTTPMTIILNEKGNFAAAESGTTTRFIKK